MKKDRNKTTKIPVAAKATKPAAVVPEVVDAAPVPLQPDLPAGGVPMEDAKVADALRALARKGLRRIFALMG